jgi:hypothetical protein
MSLARTITGALLTAALVATMAGTSFAAAGGNPGGGKAVADLAVTGSAPTAFVPIYRSFAYSLTAQNAGPDATTLVHLRSAMPGGLTVASASFVVAGCATGTPTCATPPTTGTCATGATLDCNLGKLARGVQATVSMRIFATTSGAKALAFTIGGKDTDPVATNDVARASVRVDSCSVRGTIGANTLRGTAGRDVLCGLAGNDVLIGNGGNDVLVGGPGADRLFGGVGADVLRGGLGADVLRGDAGTDSLLGDAGNDLLIGGYGADRLYGGSGNDVFSSRDGVRDTLSGGYGFDRAHYDRGLDALASVERSF